MMSLVNGNFEGKIVRHQKVGEKLYFHLGDVCNVLDIKNPRNIAKKLKSLQSGVKKQLLCWILRSLGQLLCDRKLLGLAVDQGQASRRIALPARRVAIGVRGAERWFCYRRAENGAGG